jgi:branched-chain amino acid transport system ATP-binding protein
VGSIYALIALGFNTVFNATEAINYAQGEFVMLGGMTAVAFTRAGLPLVLGAHRDGARPIVRERMAAAHALFPVLRERARQVPSTLSGGEQQMLAIGRALMAGARLLRLDELSLGPAPVVVRELYRTIMALHRRGMTILLMVEQNARPPLHASDGAYVLSTGSVVLEGRAQDLLEDEAVRKAYLG